MQRSAKLQALRQQLALQQADAFLIPRADQFQGEYIPACFERLAWISGFTGSAGYVIVMADKAAVFVDGRYTVQVQQEVDPALFEICHLSQTSPQQWLAEHMTQGQVLLLDPWLHTIDQVEKLQALAVQSAIDVRYATDNPLDAVWQDRPAFPSQPLFPWDQTLAGQTAEQKVAMVADVLQQKQCQSVFLALPESVCWLLNIRGQDVPCTPFALAYALVQSDQKVWLYMDQAKISDPSMLGKNIVVRPLIDLPRDILSSKGRMMIDPATAPYCIQQFAEKNSDLTLVRSTDPCLLPKACKNPTELAGVRAAHQRDGVAVTRFLHFLSQQSSIDELAIANQLLAFRQQYNSFVGPSFDTIAGSGPNGAIVHYRANEKSNRTLQKGELLLLDSGGQYVDGTTDITRTVILGTPTDDQKRFYTLVLKGHVMLAMAKFPKGTTGSQLDALARYALWQNQLDYDHGTGHGVGAFMSVHEGPQRISKLPNTVALQPGMILSNEPGYYLPQSFGIRIENLVAVTALDDQWYGFETLTLVPFDRQLINPDLLTDDELAWVNQYHARVRQALANDMGFAASAWLTALTTPITKTAANPVLTKPLRPDPEL